MGCIRLSRFLYLSLIHICACMNDELAKLDRSLPKPELFARMSALLDKRIHASYRMYPNNYVAHDRLEGKEDFSDHYTAEDKQRFTAYIEPVSYTHLDVYKRQLLFITSERV